MRTFAEKSNASSEESHMYKGLTYVFFLCWKIKFVAILPLALKSDDNDENYVINI